MQKLYTPAGEALSGIPWNVYPRPQMVREEWLCLNGKWDFACGGYSGQIEVPFCPESQLSGVELKMESPTAAEAKFFNPMDNSSLDSERLEQLGWSPHFTAEEGCAHTISILREMESINARG